jgi:flagellar basal body-associated protein FliL
MALKFLILIFILLGLFLFSAIVAGVVILVVFLTRKKKATPEKTAQES